MSRFVPWAAGSIDKCMNKVKKKSIDQINKVKDHVYYVYVIEMYIEIDDV